MKNVKSIAFAGILVVAFCATAFAKPGTISATKAGTISATQTGTISATRTGTISATSNVSANVSALQIALLELLLNVF